MEFLKYLYTIQLLYLYGTTLSTEVEAWPGVGDGIFSGERRLHVRIYTVRARYQLNMYSMHCMCGLEFVREKFSQRCRIR